MVNPEIYTDACNIFRYFPHKRLRGMIREGEGLYQLTEFFPFEPELGYRVDERDFTAKARGKKLKELHKKAEKIKLKNRPTFQRELAMSGICGCVNNSPGGCPSLTPRDN